jgi:hypothetical protein
MSCTLVCAIGVKLDICKRRLHFCIISPNIRMPLMWGKHISRWPHNYLLFMANQKLCIPLNVWWNNTKRFKNMKYIWWVSLQMSYGHEDWDVNYFLNNWTKMSFTKVIHDLHDVNLKAWRTIKHVCTLMGPSYNWTPPKNIIKGIDYL